MSSPESFEATGLIRSADPLMADRARVLGDALTLPVEDRARVAHELLKSLELEDGDVTATWTDEIRRRIDEVEAGTAELDDLDTVKARLEAAGRA